MDERGEEGRMLSFGCSVGHGRKRRRSMCVRGGFPRFLLCFLFSMRS
jgi:hypothetical protein